MIRICNTCGVEYKTPPSIRKFYCSNKCYVKTGSKNPKWRGGYLVNDGYKYIYAPTHPDATQAGYVLEHRLVMEKVVGRRLFRGEAVHHLNHNRLDNRAENLHLCPSNGRHFIEQHLLERDKAGRFYKAQQSVQSTLMT